MLRRAPWTGSGFVRAATAVIALATSSGVLVAQAPLAGDSQQPSAQSPPSPSEPKGSPIEAAYDKGLEIWTRDGKFRAHIDWRVQMRFSNVESEEHPGFDELIDDETSFGINRARFKTNGHAFEPWLAYKLEIELAEPRLLDFFFTPRPIDEIGARIGQFKVLYNRERVDSSGKLQFAERSIVTRPLTLDRQQGAHVLGRLFGGTAADLDYAFGV